MVDSTWLRLREELRTDLSDEEIRTWFNPLRVASEENDRLVLLAPNNRFLHTLEQSYRPVVDRAIAGLKGKGFEVLFSVAGAEPANGAANANGARRFDRRYRFDSFVVGSSNQFASAAARAVADAPGQSYNPLFLYGGVGLGKTHLLHAVGQEILARHPRLQILYLSAEQFVNELINSIRFDRMPAFRERYRTIDVLLIDDVQFLANKERTQEEFFHTFNTLYGAQRQIILSSDASPKDIPTLEERLRSRFAWGLIADIQAPDLETKVAILRRKAETEGKELPDAVALFIARQVKSNVRELEGLLNRVLAFSSLVGRPLDLAIAQETLRDILPDVDRRINGTDVVKLVARHFGLKVSEIKSRNNSKQIAFPRQVAMYLCKQLTDLSYPEIGRLFNDKHHSTVMYSVEKIEKLRVKDRDIDRMLERFAQQLQ
ncbi:MAG TPA: chromosomal replication initiator protein DnaA [Thermoanaerobaculia bacterium]|nr:chromosomal replication initiator protein DnaA [Thermoanaerobaculia bacterium]